MGTFSNFKGLLSRSYHPVRLAYQTPANSTFLSEQTSHQQSASNIFLSEQISTSHQPPAKRIGCIMMLAHQTLTSSPTLQAEMRRLGIKM
jgi:hypothetical protein